MQITKAKDMIKAGKYHPKFFIIGEPGGGKTTALTTFPPEWKVLVLDFFGNKESLEGASNVDVISYADMDPKDPEAWLILQQDKRNLINQLEKKEFKWNVLAIDTLTGLMRFCENFILITNPDGKGIGGAPAMHHYRGLSHLLGEFITSFLGFPLTIVVNAHAEMDKDELTGAMIFKAIMSGKRWRNTIYSYVGEVYRAFGETDKEGKSTKFFWQTQQDTRWVTLKSTMNQGMKFWGKYVEPNYEKLLKRRGLV